MDVVYEEQVPIATQFVTSAKQLVNVVHDLIFIKKSKYFISVISLHNFNLHFKLTES